jgi:hypothetical protein
MVFAAALPAFAVLGLSAPASAQAPVAPAAALEAAMTPGPEQARLNALVGTFDVVISIWVTPGSVPIVSNAAAVSQWVLDGRYVQTSLSGYVDGQPYKALGYAGYDNAGKVYQASWLDTDSTAQTWYSGSFNGKAAVLTASVVNPVSGKPEALELRMSIDAGGNHVTELWGTGGGSKIFKMMELRYTRSKS